MRKTLVLLVLAASLVATPAMAAGVGKGNGEIGFDFVGYTKFDSDVTEESGGLFTFRGGYHFTKTFQIEGEITASVAEDFGGDVILTRTMVNAVFNLHPGKGTITPYFLVGAGSATLEFDDTFFGDGDDSDIAYQGGFGCRFFFGKKDRVAVRIEGNAFNEGTFDETSTHLNARVGFTWALGQGK
jgi:hypothetical protein